MRSSFTWTCALGFLFVFGISSLCFVARLDSDIRDEPAHLPSQLHVRDLFRASPVRVDDQIPADSPLPTVSRARGTTAAITPSVAPMEFAHDDDDDVGQQFPLNSPQKRRRIALNTTSDYTTSDYAIAPLDDLPQSRPGNGSTKVVFLRVQKTAGTTLERIFEAKCKYQWSCDWNWHIDWNGIMQRHPGKHIVCFLRDPVERVYSEYLFLSQRAHTPPPEGMPQWDYTPEQAASLPLGSIEDFARYPDNPAHNRGARYLLGFRRPYIFLCLEDCGAWWEDYLSGQDVTRLKDDAEREAVPPQGSAPGAAVRLAIEAGWTEEELLAVLRGRLAKVELGVTDCFDASVKLLAKSFDWSEHSMVKAAQVHYRANGQNVVSDRTRRHRDELSAEAVRIIEEHNALDIRLYHMALQMLRDRLAAVGLQEDADACRPEAE